MQRKHLTALGIISTLWLGACAGLIDGTDEGEGEGEGEGSGSGEPEAPVVCTQAREYKNMGGEDLTADRPTIAVSTDRLRMKPYASLAEEYKRSLGLTDFSTVAFAGTFGKPPARWYEESTASASTIYAAFALAYDGCTRKAAAGGDFDLVPSATIADRVCRDLARVAWNREATDDEAAACATYAVNQTRATDPARTRWAYTCATVLTATHFIAY
jgi:hypothetical protein